jgi:hypothetical protein
MRARLWSWSSSLPWPASNRGCRTGSPERSRPGSRRLLPCGHPTRSLASTNLVARRGARRAARRRGPTRVSPARGTKGQLFAVAIGASSSSRCRASARDMPDGALPRRGSAATRSGSSRAKEGCGRSGDLQSTSRAGRVREGEGSPSLFAGVSGPPTSRQQARGPAFSRRALPQPTTRSRRTAWRDAP